MNEQERTASLPLCVDLDGTLLKTDTLHEMLASALHRPSVLLQVPFWVLKGRANLKAQLAAAIPFDPALLPANEELLTYLRAEKAAGRTLVLATAANERVAHAVAEHYGIFDEIAASGPDSNLKSSAKGAELSRRFGVRGFDYAGNSAADLPVWRQSNSAVLVDTPRSVKVKMETGTHISKEFSSRTGRIREMFRALRSYQWTKNTLVFAPIFASGAIQDTALWLTALIAFVAFSAMASFIYLLNDMHDLQADRQHPRKRLRPFASGSLPLSYATVLMPILLVIALVLAAYTDILFLLILYAMLSVVYSAKLKELPLVDAFTLAALYTIRIYVGGAATEITVSAWLLAFSGFLFLSLALIKRVTELQDAGDMQLRRRGYYGADRDLLTMFGVGSMFSSCVVLALYLQSDAVIPIYSSPQTLLLAIPLILLWQGRLWLSTMRGYMRDDPIVYAATDWVSILIFVCLAGTVVAARLIS